MTRAESETVNGLSWKLPDGRVVGFQRLLDGGCAAVIGTPPAFDDDETWVFSSLPAAVDSLAMWVDRFEAVAAEGPLGGMRAAGLATICRKGGDDERG